MRSVYRLQYASNLRVHTQSVIQGRKLLKPVAPTLALLGDIGLPSCRKTSEFFAWCSNHYETVYWVPGVLEMADEGKQTWAERLEGCQESIHAFKNVRICLKYNVTVGNQLQLLLSPMWNFSSIPINTYTRQGPKRMTHEDYTILQNSDMNWLLQTSARHPLPVAWLTYTSPFTGILNYPKLVCSISGTGDFIRNMEHFGYLKDAVWEYPSETPKIVSLHDQITKTLLSV